MQLVDALKKRNASTHTLARFASHLQSRPVESELPCPFCFGLGRESALVEKTKIGEILAMRCDACGDQVLLRVP